MDISNENEKILAEETLRMDLRSARIDLKGTRTDINTEIIDETLISIVEEASPLAPNPTELRNNHPFIRELEELCVKHSMTLFSGALGIRFIPRDSEGRYIEDDGLSEIYWTQSFGNKELIPVE